MQVELHDIHKSFGPVKANAGISLKFEGKKVYGLLGENGAGKSTLMKILSGYQPADRGQIILDSKPVNLISPADALAQGVGMVYQDPLDFPPFRVIDNYLLAKDNKLVLNYRQVKKEMKALLDRYDFDVDPDYLIESLSLGQRQQLELVRLLAGGAEALILDEPTTGISAEQKDVLFGSIRRLAYDEGKTVILVSHKLDEIQELCDYAYVLRRGKLVGGIEIPCPNEKLVEMMFGQIPVRELSKDRPSAEPALVLKNLSIETHRLSLQNVNLQVNAGEVFGLAGLEGSGQKLLLQACAGLLRPSQGSISLQGVDITNWSYHRRQSGGVAYIAAGRLEEGLVAGLTITEHIVLSQPKHNFMVDWGSAREITNERIATYQIVGRPDSTADELSGGNQQRLLFSLLNTPLKLILLEHPTRGLDIRSTDWIWGLLNQRRKDGTAILFMSADLDEVIERSDRIAVLSAGVMSRIVNAKETSVDELGHLIGGQA
ncbi:MAG TPA: ATP-binding cassette domain-containing protein [Anaerolineales bacterium]|nr:ATP-binding cassette domain-containing protein [Anaerolineales bacterium]